MSFQQNPAHMSAFSPERASAQASSTALEKTISSELMAATPRRASSAGPKRAASRAYTPPAPFPAIIFWAASPAGQWTRPSRTVGMRRISTTKKPLSARAEALRAWPAAPISITVRTSAISTAEAASAASSAKQITSRSKTATA